MERFLVAQSVEKEAFHPVPRARGITKWSLFRVSRQSLERLFGNSEWVTNRGCESGQDGPKESISAASYRQTSALETPSAIFQTVSRETVRKGCDG